MFTNEVKKLKEDNQVPKPAAKLGRVQNAEQKEVPEDVIPETVVQRVDSVQI